MATRSVRLRGVAGRTARENLEASHRAVRARVCASFLIFAVTPFLRQTGVRLNAVESSFAQSDIAAASADSDTELIRARATGGERESASVAIPAAR